MTRRKNDRDPAAGIIRLEPAEERTLLSCGSFANDRDAFETSEATPIDFGTLDLSEMEFLDGDVSEENAVSSVGGERGGAKDRRVDNGRTNSIWNLRSTIKTKNLTSDSSTNRNETAFRSLVKRILPRLRLFTDETAILNDLAAAICVLIPQADVKTPD